MRIQRCSPAWLATAVCMMAGLPFAKADDAPGVVRMTDYQTSYVQQSCGEAECFPTDCGCAAPVNAWVEPQCCPAPVEQYYDVGCSESCCEGSGGDLSGNGCGCGCSGRENASLLGHLFGSSKTRCNCESCDYCGKGGSGAYFNSNRTLADLLFGCMTPSGACGQGAPLLGKYQITYANEPSYADPRDGRAWGAQGYGMPITVPTAPVVRYSYNYSHGTPASRLTPLSTYNPATSPQQLYHQSW